MNTIDTLGSTSFPKSLANVLLLALSLLSFPAGAAGLYAAYTLGDVGIEHGAEELYGTTNNFVFNDIKSEYGPSAQIKIYTETPNDDELYVMDADGMGGGNTCWSESGDCDQDPDIVDFWDFYEATGNYDDHPTDEPLSEFLDDTWGVPSTR